MAELGCFIGNDDPTPSETKDLTPGQGNPEDISSHQFSKIRRRETEAQRLGSSLKTTKVPFTKLWKAVLKLRSPGNVNLGYRKLPASLK